MVAEFLLAAAGLALLTVAADHLVLGSSRLAAMLRVSPVVVGVVVIGLGTSAPEFIVSGVAAGRGDTGIAEGNLVGSNILNLTLVLGVAALIRRVRVGSTVVRREVPLAVAAVVLFGGAVWLGLTPVTGAVLLVCLVVALAVLVRWIKRARSRELAAEVEGYTDTRAPGRDSRPGSARLEWVRALGGLAGVLVGAQLLVANAATIAAHFGVSQIVIGFTLVAIGTSLPELVTTVQAQRRGETDLVVGNLFGSNLFNSLAGGAVVGFAAGSAEPAGVSLATVTAMILCAGLAWAMLRRGLELTRLEGIALLAAYALTVPLLLTA